MVTLSIVERFFKMFSLLESWLNLLQDTCNVFHHTFKLLPLYLAKRNKNGKLLIHYSTFEINQRVKLVKLFEKMFSVSSVVLDNSLKTFSIHQCCCWWKSESSLHSDHRLWSHDRRRDRNATIIIIIIIIINQQNGETACEYHHCSWPNLCMIPVKEPRKNWTSSSTTQSCYRQAANTGVMSSWVDNQKNAFQLVSCFKLASQVNFDQQQHWSMKTTPWGCYQEQWSSFKHDV